MNRLIRIASTVPDAEGMRTLLSALEYMVVPLDDKDDPNHDGTAAMILGLDRQAGVTAARAKALRTGGFRGAILVLGTVWPDLAARQALAEAKAWFIPAMTGPADAVDRVNHLMARE